MSSQTFELILDKGTLDAIASGGTTLKQEVDYSAPSPSQSNRRDVSRYCLEMWRVLAQGGQWAVVTTMPPHIFEALVITPIEAACLNCVLGDEPVCDWRRGHIATDLRTPAGGTVYYYSIAKHKDTLDTKTRAVNALLSVVGEAIEAKDGAAWAELVSR